MTMLPYALGDRLGIRASLGLIVLRTDETIEHDFRTMLPGDGVALYTSRIPCETEVTPDALIHMKAALPASAALLPHSITYDVIGYACTSGATIIGPATVAAELRKGAEARHVTDPLTAALAALDALKVERLGFLSPYVPSVSAAMREIFTGAGIQIVSFASFGEDSDERIARIDGASIVAAAEAIAAAAPCDAIFMSCTNLRAAALIETLEERLGIPVLSSNQVLAWHMMRLAGLSEARPGFGALLSGQQRTAA